jgi:hypothetical protein
MSQPVPEMIPVLSRGKHRRPEDGACFMEMVSVLGGNRWSDNPPGTHPLLAHLARLVNDFTSDARRPMLSPMVPSVIGLDDTDPHWDDAIAVLAASVALPLATSVDQPALAAGLLTSAARLDAAQRPEIASLRARGRAVLATTPDAAAWAQDFTDHLGPARTRARAGWPVVDFSVRSIVASGSPRTDDDLRELLAAAIALCQRLTEAQVDTQGAAHDTTLVDHAVISRLLQDTPAT